MARQLEGVLEKAPACAIVEHAADGLKQLFLEVQEAFFTARSQAAGRRLKS